PCKPRMIVDDALGDLSRGAADPAGWRQQLPQGDTAIEHAARRARTDPNAAGIHEDAVAGIPYYARVRIHFERDCRVRVSRSRCLQLQSARVRHQLYELIHYGRDSPAIRTPYRDPGAVGDRERTRPGDPCVH